MIELASPVLDPRTHGQRTRLELPDISGAVVSGKYGPGLQPAYQVRSAFEKAGIEVAFPRGDTPIESYSGYTFSEDAEQYVPFPYMQDRFFQLIEENPFHTVVTGKNSPEGQTEGYLGFSSAHEVAYAILKAKPIIMSSRIEQFSDHVPSGLAEIISKNQNQVIIKDLARQTTRELKRTIAELPQEVNYALNYRQIREIENRRDDLCDLEMHRWFSWTIKTERDYFGGKRSDWINERNARFGIVPRPYLSPEELARDQDAQHYIDPITYGSFMIHMHFPDFGD